MSIEHADQKVWVRASRELLEQMQEGWSPAVRVRATVDPDGAWELTFRAAYNDKGEMVDMEAQHNGA